MLTLCYIYKSLTTTDRSTVKAGVWIGKSGEIPLIENFILRNSKFVLSAALTEVIVNCYSLWGELYIHILISAKGEETEW